MSEINESLHVHQPTCKERSDKIDLDYYKLDNTNAVVLTEEGWYSIYIDLIWSFEVKSDHSVQNKNFRVDFTLYNLSNSTTDKFGTVSFTELLHLTYADAIHTPGMFIERTV